jgi:hypothetical protein
VTYEQGVRIAARALAVYLVVWAVSDAIGLPAEIMAVRHHLQAAAIPRESMPVDLEASVVYYLRVSIMALASTILRIALWLMAARWFYYCGPRIQKILGLWDAPGGEGHPQNAVR